MRYFIAVLLSLCLGATIVTHAGAQRVNDLVQQIDNLPWKKEGFGTIGGRSTISITPSLQFLDSTSTRRFLELNGNPPRDNEFVLAQRDFSWFAVFTYDDSGHVLDNEKIDADALLARLKAGNRHGVEERKRLGLEPLYLEGWSVPPHYDLETKRLEWGTRLRTESGEPVVNYTTRLLGRTGVTSVILVTTPENFETDVRAFKAALRGFSYVSGQAYAEYRQGDRLAEYGLGALIVGGAAAAAAKTGAFKGLAKMLGLGVVGLLSALGAFGRKLLGRA